MASLDTWAVIRTRATVPVRDNARILHAITFQAQLAAWEDQNAYLFWLSTYCPPQQNQVALAQGQIRSKSGRKPTTISKLSWSPFGTFWTEQATIHRPI